MYYIDDLLPHHGTCTITTMQLLGIQGRMQDIAKGGSFYNARVARGNFIDDHAHF
jgi:hypothetical protein